MNVGGSISAKVVVRWAVVCSIVAAASAALTARVAMRRFGPVQVGDDLVYRVPASPSRVTETSSDSSGDGRTDTWTVSIREGEDGGLTYIAHDYGGDGVPDSWCAWFGQIFSAGYGLKDDDKDGKPDRQLVWVPDASGSRKSVYDDLDLDGELDTKFDVGTATRYVLLDGAWVPAVRRGHDAHGQTHLIKKPDGGEAEVLFLEGKWRLTSRERENQ